MLYWLYVAIDFVEFSLIKNNKNLNKMNMGISPILYQNNVKNVIQFLNITEVIFLKICKEFTMELILQNIGIIKKNKIKIKGLTVICWNNNSGKSTIGKALYATIETLSNLEEKVDNELITNYRRALANVSRLLDLDSIVR